MKNLLKRLGRAVLDLVTSKKAIAAAAAAIGGATGLPAEAVAPIVGYVIAQGIADRGKEQAKKEAQLRAEVVALEDGRAVRDKKGNIVWLGADRVTGKLANAVP